MLIFSKNDLVIILSCIISNKSLLDRANMFRFTWRCFLNVNLDEIYLGLP